MRSRLACVLLGLVLGACARTPENVRPQPDAPARQEPFYEGTPAMRETVDAIVTELPGTTGARRLALAERLMACGEPALPRLVALLEDPDPDVRTLAAWLLGRWKDPRTLDALDRAQADADDAVRFEAATALVRAGDSRGMPVLVDGLVHSDPRVRSRAIHILEQVTGETFGYRADDHPHDRRAAVARWTHWLESRAAPPGS